jgi:hypothetical protein
MRPPSPEQAARIAVLWRHLSPVIAAVWRDTAADARNHLDYMLDRVVTFPEYASLRDETARQVTAHVPADDPAWADFLCFPTATEPDLLRDYQRHPEWEYRALASRMAGHIVGSTPTPYAADLIAERLRYMLGHVVDQTEASVSDPGQYERLYSYPRVSPCLKLLARCCERDVAGAIPSAEAIIDGAFNDAHDSAIVQFCRTVLPALHRAGRLTYERFCEIVERYPSAFPGHYLRAPDPKWRRKPISTADEFAVRDLANRLAWATVQTLDDRTIRVLDKWYLADLLEGRWLIKACEHIERHGLAVVRASGGEGVEGICARLARIAAVPAAERAATVAALRGMKPATRLMVLPVAQGGQPVVLEALGWSGALALVNMIQELGRRADQDPGEYRLHDGDVGNTANPTTGVVDRHEIVRAIQDAGEKQTRAIFKAFRKATGEFPNTLTLLQAAAGWNADTIRKGVERRAQIPVKAYGLLPITGGDEEVRERYLLLKQIEREAGAFSPERSAKSRAAVQVGLQNLALNAGCRDLFQLECRMEAFLAETGPAIGTTTSVQDWQVALTIEDGQPGVSVHKGGKRLKSVPPAVRRSADYVTLKARADDLRTQATRVRQSLERALVAEDRFSREDLALIAKLPAGRPMVTSVVWRTADGYGWYDADAQVMRDLAGTALSLDQGATLAHPWHLFRDDALEAWQRATVHRRIRQPFKQVFRELYVLTPVEREARVESTRFASHTLKADVAARLLQARAWYVTLDDVLPLKIFRAAALHAEFCFENTGRALATGERVTTGTIVFKRGLSRDRFDGLMNDDDSRVPLTDVPPVIFSEVMRDADLVVSVAHHEASDIFSDEICRHRSELVAAIVGDLALPNVTCHGHFAHITGERATYRVHLGSGSVFLGATHHLCIVSEATYRRADLYLPFVDPEPKTSEVLSKVLLLANDRQITDPAILDQISRLAVVGTAV